MGESPWEAIRRSDLGKKPVELKIMRNDDDTMLEKEGSGVEEQNEGLGIDQIEAHALDEKHEKDIAKDDDPYGVKKRLGMQAKKHQKEMRQMQEQLSQLQSQVTNPNQRNYHPEPANPYNSPGQPSQVAGGEEERIRQAVEMAMNSRMQSEQTAEMNKKYAGLHGELARGSDKYDDFDDVVNDRNAPFTPHIRDAMLLIDNAPDVAYKLGKNRSELARISQLHPIDQAKEVNRLSFALMGGNNGGKAPNPASSPLQNPKPNPASASTATGNNMNAASIRARMKANTWK